ncbi:tetratricopeptide repeat protein [candidate division KSB1 bacterium]|nr:tetratricopeptide repeat protein [candidate division KSB1 bacterium]
MIYKRDKDSQHMRSSAAGNDYSGAKRILFYVILMILPFLLLALLELGLDLFNYGGNLDLFVQSATGEEYVLNPNVTARYFFHKGVKTPTPITQSFAAEKDSLTCRIFCLGASTTQGFPYEVNAAFPAVLKNILSTVHPDRHVQVINCGITALTSHSVLDLGREILLKYEPDLLVIYSGHNEFYGVFGQASRLALFKSRGMTKLFLRLQKLRTTRLLRNMTSGLRAPRMAPPLSQNAETLMGQMAGNIEIRLDSQIFRQTERYFKENIGDLVDLTKRRGVPVMLCSLVDNQRDFPPFASLHAEALSEQDTTLWRSHVREAVALQDAGEFAAALASYARALALDSTFADVHYQMAVCYDAIGDEVAARSHYRLARDHDVIRFRAPSCFNRHLQDLARQYDVPYVDAQSEFARESRSGVIGADLIHEHVHPNQRGYFLIAKAIARSMYEHGLMDGTWQWVNDKSDSAYMAMSHLTPLDYEVVNYKIFILTSHWPFPAGEQSHYERVGNARTEQMARALVDRGEGHLVQYHLDYGDEFLQLNQFEPAEAEYLAAHAIQPLPETFNRLGRLYLRQTEIAYRDMKDYDMASTAYAKGVALLAEGLERWPDDIGLNFNLGLLHFMRTDRNGEALARFLKVLELQPGHKNALQQASELYLRRSQPDSAEILLRKGIELFPEEARFYTTLGLICLQENRTEEAERLLAAAVARGDDRRARHFLNQLRARRGRKSEP